MTSRELHAASDVRLRRGIRDPVAPPAHQEKPQTFSDINPQFMQQLGGWSKNEAQLDLRELLNRTSSATTAKALCPSRSTPTSPPTGKSCATCPRMTRPWSPRPATAGTCPIPTRRATWRSCARRRCSRSSRNTKRSRRTQGLPPGSCPRRIQESLAGARLRRHRRRGRQDPQQRPGRRSQAAHVVRPGSNKNGRRIMALIEGVKIQNYRSLHDIAMGKIGTDPSLR